MTKEEILEGNKLIAEFMGAIAIDNYPDHALLDFVKKENYPNDSRYHSNSLLRYHFDWSWIIPVIKRIESVRNITVAIAASTCRIWNFTDCLFSMFGETKEEAVFSAIIQFVKYYNFNNKNLASDQM